MADFNEMKEKAADFAFTAAGKAKDFASFATDRAKKLTRQAKLSLELNTEKERQKKIFADIGRLYYETHRENPEGFFIQLVEEAGVVAESIAAKEAELASLKAVQEEDVTLDDSDFETVVAETEAAAEAPVETPTEPAPDAE